MSVLKYIGSYLLAWVGLYLFSFFVGLPIVLAYNTFRWVGLL